MPNPLKLMMATAGVAGGVEGEVWTWGENDHGQLGDGTTTNRSSPVQVGSLTVWSAIAGGEDTCAAVKSDGTLWTWGRGTFGALGDGTTTSKSSPVQVGSLTNWSAVSLGPYGQHVLAIKTDGTLWAWGGGTYGRLGDGAATSKSSPVQIGNLTDWATAVAGRYHSGAVKTDGTLWMWGQGSVGKLGLGNTTNYSSPVQVGSLTNWSILGLGRFHTSAVKTDGTLWAWGDNSPKGQIGDGTTTDRSSPVQVGSLTNWKSLTTRILGVSAIKTDGTLWSWGNGFKGQLGDGTAVYPGRSSPVQIGSLTNWDIIFGGSNAHCIAVKTDGTLWSWGYNSADGQLGDGTTTDRSSPVQIGSLTTWQTVSLGHHHSVAIK